MDMVLCAVLLYIVHMRTYMRKDIDIHAYIHSFLFMMMMMMVVVVVVVMMMMMMMMKMIPSYTPLATSEQRVFFLQAS